MKNRIRHTLFALLGGPMLLQVGCFSAADFQAIAEGQPAAPWVCSAGKVDQTS